MIFSLNISTQKCFTDFAHEPKLESSCQKLSGLFTGTAIAVPNLEFRAATCHWIFDVLIADWPYFEKDVFLCNFWDKTYADKPFWKMYSVVEWSVNIHFVAGYGTNFCIKTKFLFKSSVSGSIHTLIHWMLNERLIWKQMINLHKLFLFCILILHFLPNPSWGFMAFCLFKNFSVQNVTIFCWMEKVFTSSFLVIVVAIIPSLYYYVRIWLWIENAREK